VLGLTGSLTFKTTACGLAGDVHHVARVVAGHLADQRQAESPGRYRLESAAWRDGRRARRCAPARSRARPGRRLPRRSRLPIRSVAPPHGFTPPPPCRRALAKRLRTMCLIMAASQASSRGSPATSPPTALASSRTSASKSISAVGRRGTPGCARAEKQQLLYQGIKLHDVFARAVCRDRAA